MLKQAFFDPEFGKKLRSLVLPIALQQLMLSVVSASDAIMLNFLSSEKMAAVSLATQVTFVYNLFLAAMTIGLSILAAQYWGKEDNDAVERIFAYVLAFTIAVSALFFLATLLFPSLLMQLLTNEPNLISGGAEYLRLVAPSYLLTGVSQIYLCLFKNSGHAKQASLISSLCMIGDLIMNFVLILGVFGFPRLGIAGAALSTTLARAVEAVWCVVESRKKDRLRLRYRHLLHSDRQLRKDFWHHTFPVLGNELVWGVGFTMFSVIMGHLGTDAVAANSIANIVKNLLACFCLGLAGGGGILIGNELGAGELARAKDYGDRLLVWSVVSGILSGVVLLVCSPFVLSFADLNDTATYYLKWMLVVCAYYMIGKSVNCTAVAGIFCAGGDSKFGFLCDAVVMWGIAVPIGLICTFVLRLPVIAVYVIVSADELLKLPAVLFHYRKYQWVKNLTAKEDIPCQ